MESFHGNSRYATNTTPDLSSSYTTSYHIVIEVIATYVHMGNQFIHTYIYIYT